MGDVTRNKNILLWGECMKDLRKVEVLINNEWVERDFAELRKGVKFKMFEPTGEPVVDNEGGNRMDSYIRSF